MLLQDIFQRKVRLGNQDGADHRQERRFLAIPLIKTAVPVHSLFKRDQVSGFDPPAHHGTGMGVTGNNIIPCNLPEAYDGEMGPVLVEPWHKKKVWPLRLVYEIGISTTQSVYSQS